MQSTKQHITTFINLCKYVSPICIWNFNETRIDVVYVISLQANTTVIIYNKNTFLKTVYNKPIDNVTIIGSWNNNIKTLNKY